MTELTLQEQSILLAVFHLEEKASLISIRDFLIMAGGKEYAIGTIYVPLERLRRRGLLDVQVAAPLPRAGGRAVKYYRLSAMGRRALVVAKRKLDRLWKGFAPLATEG